MKRALLKWTRGAFIFLFALFSPWSVGYFVSLTYRHQDIPALLIVLVAIGIGFILRPSIITLSGMFLWITLVLITAPLGWDTHSPANITFDERDYNLSIYGILDPFAFLLSIGCFVAHRWTILDNKQSDNGDSVK